MSQNMLHIVAASRMSNKSVIVSDRTALNSLWHAIEDALATGSGGASVSTSDGEFHSVAIVLEDDMYPVYTTYRVRAGTGTVRQGNDSDRKIEELFNRT